MESASSSKKPKLELSSSQEENTQPLTPTKNAARPDGHLSTPSKKNLNFDFWAQFRKTSEKSEKIPGIVKVGELKVGGYFNETLKVRVSYKCAVRGKVLTFHGMDETGEIGIVAFGEVAGKLFDDIQINSIYDITDFRVTPESEKFKRGCDTNLEVVLKENSVVKPVMDSNFQQIPFSFLELGAIKGMEVRSKVDALGILVNVGDVAPVKSGALKRDISLTDRSMATMTAALWGKAADNFAAEMFTPIALRGASVAEYEGITSVNCFANALVWIDPDIDEGRDLKEWFNQTMEKVNDE